jgi:hypothetical protein
MIVQYVDRNMSIKIKIEANIVKVVFIFEGCILLRLFFRMLFLLLFHTHYMFRPLQAIFTWTMY